MWLRPGEHCRGERACAERVCDACSGESPVVGLVGGGGDGSERGGGLAWASSSSVGEHCCCLWLTEAESFLLCFLLGGLLSSVVAGTLRRTAPNGFGSRSNVFLGAGDVVDRWMAISAVGVERRGEERKRGKTVTNELRHTMFPYIPMHYPPTPSPTVQFCMTQARHPIKLSPPRLSLVPVHRPHPFTIPEVLALAYLSFHSLSHPLGLSNLILCRSVAATSSQRCFCRPIALNVTCVFVFGTDRGLRAVLELSLLNHQHI